MIGYIKGTVLASFKTGKAVSSLVVWPYNENDSGVGITIVVTDVTAAQFPPQAKISLWTYYVVSENAQFLIGLQSRESMESFLSLLDVSGVGPKTALHIVDTLGVTHLLEAIKTQDITAISKVPGVGKKTAAKIVLELAQNPSLEALVSNQSTEAPQTYATVAATLQKLGYPAIKVREAINSVKKEFDAKPELTVSEQVTLLLSKGIL